MDKTKVTLTELNPDKMIELSAEVADKNNMDPMDALRFLVFLSEEDEDEDDDFDSRKPLEP